MQKFYVGYSNNIKAECAYASDDKFTVLEMYDNEPVGVEGFSSKVSALNAVKEAKEAGCDVYEYFYKNY